MTPAAASRLRVRYAETDAMGIVHHASYLVWCEVGRTDLLRQLGIPYTAFEAQGIQSPVVEIAVRYRSPARYDDSIRIHTRLVEIGAATVRFEYDVLREDDSPESSVLLATASSLHCFLNSAGRPVALRKLPQPLRDVLASLAGNA